MNEPIRTEKRFFHALDGLRGVAAILVMIYHATASFPDHMFARGYLAVDFFFALSGFVIEHAYGRRDVTAWAFFAQRSIRLYPTIALASLLAFACSLADDRCILLLKQLLLLPSLQDHRSVFPLETPMWSMLSEVVANILFFVTLQKLAMRGLSAVCAVAAIWFLYACRSHHTFNMGWEPSDLIGIGRVMFSFSLGMILRRLDFDIRPLHWLLCAAALTILLVTPHIPAGDLLIDVVIGMVVLPILLAVAARANVPTVWRPACRWLGLVSYPLYLLHMPLLDLGARHGLTRAVPERLFVCTLILGFAAVCTHGFDVPVRAWVATRGRRYGSLQVKGAP